MSECTNLKHDNSMDASNCLECKIVRLTTALKKIAKVVGTSTEAYKIAKEALAIINHKGEKA
jgi:hypothetical protein